MKNKIVSAELSSAPWNVYYVADRRFVRNSIKAHMKADKRRWFESEAEEAAAERNAKQAGEG